MKQTNENGCWLNEKMQIQSESGFGMGSGCAIHCRIDCRMGYETHYEIRCRSRCEICYESCQIGSMGFESVIWSLGCGNES